MAALEGYNTIMFKVLFLGDIVGKPGRQALAKAFPSLKRRYKPTFVIANCENAVHSAGINREKLTEILALRVDACTSGDHSLDIRGAEELFQSPDLPIVGPGNWTGGVAGRGWRIIRKGKKSLLLLCVMGRVFIKHPSDDPFTSVERMLAEARKQKYDCSLLDVHAEATSEKRAIAEAFDGRIDVIVGTHTHVQTNDGKTLPKGTGFLTDAGMCGPTNSILGLRADTIIRKFRTNISQRNEPAEGPCEVSGCLATIGKKGTKMELVRVEGITVDNG